MSDDRGLKAKRAVRNPGGSRAASALTQTAYLLAALPFLADYLKTGRLPLDAMSLAVDAVIAGAILTAIFLARSSRRRELLIDGLRKTLNESIIHDLKNPMTSIMGCLSVLIHSSPEPEQKRFLQLALHSCRSQMALLETLVDTSRIEGGELVPERSLFPVRELLDTILDDTRGAAAHLGVILHESVDPDLPTDVYADPELLQRILSNLIHNALKYTPSHGSVSLETSFDESGFRFTIKDTGIGIAPDNIKRLFSKYYRVEGADQGTRRGSGLGLYFCRLAVEAHGGMISVSSEVGTGTTITFNMPSDTKRSAKND